MSRGFVSTRVTNGMSFAGPNDENAAKLQISVVGGFRTAREANRIVEKIGPHVQSAVMVCLTAANCIVECLYE